MLLLQLNIRQSTHCVNICEEASRDEKLKLENLRLQVHGEHYTENMLTLDASRVSEISNEELQSFLLKWENEIEGLVLLPEQLQHLNWFWVLPRLKCFWVLPEPSEVKNPGCIHLPSNDQYDRGAKRYFQLTTTLDETSHMITERQFMFRRLKLCSDLFYLHLSACCHYLPPEVCNMKCLEILNISGSNLVTLPNEIRDLKLLHRLVVSCNNLISLPETLGQCVNLEHLDCPRNNLTTLPETLGQCVNLVHLDCSRNKLTTLPETLGQCVNLVHLDCSRNKLTTLPKTLGQCVNLKHLDCSRNKLTTLPETLGQCVNLVHLDCSRCFKMKTLPEKLGQCVNLVHLDCSRNELTTLPETLGQCVDLEHLDCSRNELTTLPETLGQCVNLVHLDCSWCFKMTTLPETLGQCVNLVHLDCSRNKLTTLPETLGQCVNLVHLDCSRCFKMTTLPEKLGQCVNLVHLDCSRNELTTLPETLGQCVNLVHLDCSRCFKMTTLPEKLGQCVNLVHLDCSRNELTTLPETLGQCVNLVHLDCSRNKLTTLPETLGQCVNLKHLNCSENKLTTLPETLGQCVNLVHLDCSRNELTTLPETLGQCVDLEHLDCSWCFKMTTLPETLGQCVNLVHLDCSRNKLTTLPETLGQCVNLKHLNCSENKLTTLPETLGQCVNLVHLDCSRNELTTLPETLGQCVDLEHLDCSWCFKMTTLPETLGQCVNLVHLDCSRNELTTLPETLGQCVDLEHLDCSRNKLTTLPETLGQCVKLKYFNITELPLVKKLIFSCTLENVGESSVAETDVENGSLRAQLSNLKVLTDLMKLPTQPGLAKGTLLHGFGPKIWKSGMVNIEKERTKIECLSVLPSHSDVLAIAWELQKVGQILPFSFGHSEGNREILPNQSGKILFFCRVQLENWYRKLLAEDADVPVCTFSKTDFSYAATWSCKMKYDRILQFSVDGENQPEKAAQWLSSVTLDRLSHVALLTLSGCGLETVPTAIYTLKTLLILDMRYNKLFQISDDVEKLVLLECLILTNNNLKTLPSGLSRLHNLRVLCLGKNRITQLHCSSLPHRLECLKLSQNNLCKILLGQPQSNCDPKDTILFGQLQALDLSDNTLSDLPGGLFNGCLNLCLLNVSGNRLINLPGQMSGLPIEYLIASTNGFSVLPNVVKRLEKLKYLDVEDCHLRLPHWLGNMKNLETLKISHKQLVYPPGLALAYAETESLSLETILKLLETMASEKGTVSVKMGLLGVSGAGKTSLALSILHNRSSLTRKEDRTKGMSRITVRCEGVELAMQDVGGHSDYYFLHEAILLGPALIAITVNLLEYDETFECFMETVGQFYIAALARCRGDLKVIVVGTHCDTRSRGAEFNTIKAGKKGRHIQKCLQELQNSYVNQLGNIMDRLRRDSEPTSTGHTTTMSGAAQQLSALDTQITSLPTVPDKVWLTSSESLINHEKLRHALASMAAEIAIQDSIPLSWLAMADFVSTLTVQDASQVLLMTTADVKALFKGTAETFQTAQSVEFALNFLSSTAQLIHFADKPALRDTVFLNLNMLSDLFGAIFHHDLKNQVKAMDELTEDAEVFRRTAVLSIHLLKKVWFAYHPEMAKNNSALEKMVLLMERLDLGQRTVLPKPTRAYRLEHVPLSKRSEEIGILLPWFIAAQDHMQAEAQQLWEKHQSNEVTLEYKIGILLPKGLWERCSLRLFRHLISMWMWTDGVCGSNNTAALLARQKRGNEGQPQKKRHRKVMTFGDRESWSIIWTVRSQSPSESPWPLLVECALDLEALLTEWPGLLVQRRVRCPCSECQKCDWESCGWRNVGNWLRDLPPTGEEFVCPKDWISPYKRYQVLPDQGEHSEFEALSSSYCKSRIFRMHFIFVYFIRGGFRLKIKCACIQKA